MKTHTRSTWRTISRNAAGLGALLALAGCPVDLTPRRLDDPSLGGFPIERLNQYGLSMQWSARLPGKEIQAVYLAGADSDYPENVLVETKDHELHCFDRGFGSPLWMSQRIPGSLTQPPFATEDNLYAVSGGSLYVLDVADLNRKLGDRAPSGPNGARLRPTGDVRYHLALKYLPYSPVVSDDQHLAYCSRSGEFVSIPVGKIDSALRNGENPPLKPDLIRWMHKAEGTPLPAVLLPPRPGNPRARQDAAIFSLGEGQLICRGMADYNSTDRRWIFPSAGDIGPLSTLPTLRDHWIAAATADRHLYVVDGRSGVYMAETLLDGACEFPPVAVGTSPERMRIYASLAPQGFCKIRVADPKWIVRKETILVEDPDKPGRKIRQPLHETPRWLLEVQWKLPGRMRFLSEGVRSVFLQDLDSRELVIADKETGAVRHHFSLGGIDIIVPDMTEPEGAKIDTGGPADAAPQRIPPLASRLFLATRDGWIYSVRER